jgi:hypothetical protein
MTEEADKKAAEEAQKELFGRTEEFNKELIPLLGKYELGLGASAFLNPNGTIGARPILFDARKKAEEAAKPEATGAAEGGAVAAA